MEALRISTARNLLSVVLVLFLLFGAASALSGDSRKTQSDAYWRGEARPFTIVEHSEENGYLLIVIQNVESEPKTLTLFAVGGSSIPGGTNSTPVSFAGGEKKQISLAMSEKCTSGSTYDLNITFGYDDGKTQKGAKNLIGKCDRKNSTQIDQINAILWMAFSAVSIALFFLPLILGLLLAVKLGWEALRQEKKEAWLYTKFAFWIIVILIVAGSPIIFLKGDLTGLVLLILLLPALNAILLRQTKQRWKEQIKSDFLIKFPLEAIAVLQVIFFIFFAAAIFQLFNHYELTGGVIAFGSVSYPIVNLLLFYYAKKMDEETGRAGSFVARYFKLVAVLLLLSTLAYAYMFLFPQYS
jgi:hypothetical protein